MFGEVLEAFDHLEAEPSYEGERGVATSCEHLGGMAGVSAGVVFATGDVANVMKTGLDARDNASNCYGPVRCALRLVIA